MLYEKQFNEYLASTVNKFRESTQATVPSKLRTLLNLGFDPETCFNELKEQGYSVYTIKIYFLIASKFETTMLQTTKFYSWLKLNAFVFRNSYNRDLSAPAKTQIDSIIYNKQLDPEFRNLFILMSYAGLRVSEASKITWDDIKGTTIKVIGKGGKPRSVQLSSDYIKLLRENSLQVPPRKQHNKSVAAVSVSKLRSQWSALELDFTPHGCRRFYVSYLLNDLGFSVTEVARLVGHSNIATTNLYARTSDKELDDKIQLRMRA